jgi:hypothetical protein
MSSLPRLHGDVQEVSCLSPPERDSLFGLFDRHFQGVTRQAFEADLMEKRWVILLRWSDGALAGFSTLVDFEVTVSGEPIRALFSGDTIVDPSAWGRPELARTWGSVVFPWAESEPSRRAFWFLICSGFRTYRFLPVFFSRFIPNVGGTEHEDWLRILRSLARHRYGEQYDEESGIVRLRNPTPLRRGVGDPSDRERADRDVQFFVERNPGWTRGDDLACLALIARENVTRAGERMLRPSRA